MLSAFSPTGQNLGMTWENRAKMNSQALASLAHLSTKLCLATSSFPLILQLGKDSKLKRHTPIPTKSDSRRRRRPHKPLWPVFSPVLALCRTQPVHPRPSQLPRTSRVLWWTTRRAIAGHDYAIIDLMRMSPETSDGWPMFASNFYTTGSCCVDTCLCRCWLLHKS